MNNETTNEHYSLLLGLTDPWRVDRVDFDPDGGLVVIHVVHDGGGLCCPECGEECPQADLARSRRWRHLDTMQFRTEIVSRTPRSDCQECGVKTIRVPWADKHSRFTLLFEAFAIDVLQACSSIKRAAELLGLSWHTCHNIMARAVDRGLARRSLQEVRYVGIDEKSFRRGHDYISIMTDIDESRVLEVSEGRKIESADQLWATFTADQKELVLGVAMDMWPAFATSTEQNAPNAEIIHDKFHVSKHLNEAVDKVRRTENKQLTANKDDRLVGTKQLWLFAKKNLKGKGLRQLNELKEKDLKTSRAWALKENFRRFWRYVFPVSAEAFFKRWYQWASRCQLKPVVKVAKMIKAHLPRLLSYFRHNITNAKSEGFNSRIQSIKSAARGFSAFKNYRTRILFYCGKLDLTHEM